MFCIWLPWAIEKMCEILYSPFFSFQVTNSNQTPLHLAVSNNQGPETLMFLMSLPQTSLQQVRNKLGDTVEDLILRNTPYSELCHPFSQCATQLSKRPLP